MKDGAAINRIIKDMQRSKVFLHETWKTFGPILGPCTSACTCSIRGHTSFTFKSGAAQPPLQPCFQQPCLGLSACVFITTATSVVLFCTIVCGCGSDGGGGACEAPSVASSAVTSGDIICRGRESRRGRERRSGRRRENSKGREIRRKEGGREEEEWGRGERGKEGEGNQEGGRKGEMEGGSEGMYA